ncbi:MAG: hypothetical protein IJ328_05845 [Muribaculaceae bacterium]|nr:hypothetical protein [Muribaculaceae bacterium]
MKDVKETMRGILWLVGLISAVGVCVYYIVNGTFHPILILVLLICLYPWCEGFWNLFYYECSDNRNKRILKRILPKIGFSITYENEYEVVPPLLYIFVGNYKGEKFMIKVFKSFITVIDLPWYEIEETEYMLPILEATNEVNNSTGFLSMLIRSDVENKRCVYTAYQIVLPEYKPENHLENMLNEMLACKREFMETLKEKRAEESLPNRKIGFAFNDKNT